MQYTHQSVRDYVAAKKRGDYPETQRILNEVQARFATRETDGSEAAELLSATMAVRLGEGE
ncbi:hypothetical protein OOK29_09705 [Streptomyces phaeochromogenes]|uniref:hypothetical protein n=1 Tax=Streptomyces phaeochromogenes TaxID=1923 RepID=UPI00225A0011|nr:hypothetical protein [Streptomyces phaeochromogenes]MCX5598412.1 hypothetical protein [Streptomyces phaeochromogenes]